MFIDYSCRYTVCEIDFFTIDILRHMLYYCIRVYKLLCVFAHILKTGDRKMKKLKVISILLSVVLLTMIMTPAALAINTNADYYKEILGGVVDSDTFGKAYNNLNNNNSAEGQTSVSLGTSGTLSAIAKILQSRFGGSYNVDEIIAALQNALGNADLNSILSGGLSSALGKLTSGSIMSDIMKYLQGESESTTEETTEEETEEETEKPTEAATEAPATQSNSVSYVYVPVSSAPDTYVVETTTEEVTTMEEYTAPERVTVQTLETESTTYEVVEDTSSSGVTVKMVIGIILLVLSAAAVVVVAVILKKSRV